MSKIKVTILFTQKFRDYCKKYDSRLTQDEMEKKIKDFLE